MIRLEDITVAYDDRIILNHVNLDIHDGETLAVIGASGSGKSTTLRLIMGLQKPTSGRVYIDGEDITDYSEEKMDDFLTRVESRTSFRRFTPWSEQTKSIIERLSGLLRRRD